jgi:HK97 family phage major capsid protein
MKRSDELRDLKAQKVTTMRSVADGAKGRQLTAEERTNYDNLKKEIEALNQEIEDAAFLENEERHSAETQRTHQRQTNGGEEGEMNRIAKSYSLMRAINRASTGKPLDGLEGEMHQQAENEARAIGLTTSGNVQIPGMIRRDMTAGTTTAGGHTVPTDLGALIPILEPKLMVEAMGATMLTGLTGNLDIPRNDADAAATWEGENDANAETSPTFDKISLSPKRLGAFTDISKQLMVQSSISVENFIRQRLNFAIASALDSAAINGSGSAPIPRGILNVSGIGDVAGGTNGATPDWADIVDLESQLTIDNADLGRLGYLTTPGVRGYLKKPCLMLVAVSLFGLLTLRRSTGTIL